MLILTLLISCLYIQVVINLRLKIRGHSLRLSSKLTAGDLTAECSIICAPQHQGSGVGYLKQNKTSPHTDTGVPSQQELTSAHQLHTYTAPNSYSVAFSFWRRNLSPSLRRLSAEYAANNFYYIRAIVITMHFIEFNDDTIEAICARHS